MKRIILANLIKEIKTEAELDSEIELYFKTKAELDKKKREIEEQLKEIKNIEKSLKNKFSKVQNYMEEHKINEKKVNKWVARLKEVAAYKRVAPDYKELWLTALKKVNEATRGVLQSIEDANVEAKKSAKKIELELVEEGIFDIIKSLINKFKKLFSSFDKYKKVSNSLPELKV